MEGLGLDAWTEAEGVIDAGNSGSTARMLTGILAGHRGLAVLTGDASLRSRPMLRVVAPLRAMGASIDGRAHGDRLPLVIKGGGLRGRDHELAVASAQVKSALLLAGLHAEGITSVTEPMATRDHTELMLAAAGISIGRNGRTITISGGQTPVGLDIEVPGDISAAMFLIVAALLVDGSALTLTNVGLNPTRTAALDVLVRMGGDIRRTDERWSGGEPVGDLEVHSSSLKATQLSAVEIANAIDEVPALAIAASQAEGTTVFEGIGELRAKESDRVGAIVEGLRAMGVSAEAGADSLAVEGPCILRGARVESRGDHRIAMAFAVAGMLSTAPVQVTRWSCVDTSFPGFLEVVGRAQGRRR